MVSIIDSAPSDAQRERLEIVAEEAAEVIVAVNKILRHGWVSGEHQNRIGLEHELGDLQWAIKQLVDNDDVWQETIDRFAAEKPAKAAPYLHHN